MNYKYDYRAILQDLDDHNIDIKKFELKCKKISGCETMNQHMFEFLYETLVVNNYNSDLIL